jgi:hypothetical protein
MSSIRKSLLYKNMPEYPQLCWGDEWFPSPLETVS